MKLNWNYRLKGRALKTALAVFLTQVLAVVLNRNSAFYSSIAAVICLMKTHDATKEKGIERLIGTVLGGVIGWGFLEVFIRIPHYMDWVYPLIAPLGVLCVIYCLNVLNRQTSCMIGCVVYLSIVVNFNRTLEEIPVYVINRVLDTALGIMMAAFVTWLPFEYFTKERKKDE